MVYENDTLQFFAHPEGRIVFNATENIFQYQYTITDHQGNVRVLLAEPVTTEVTATLETAEAANEEAEFLYYENVSKINSTLFDHTNSGTTHYAVRLNGTANEQIGLARSLAVAPGDKITAEVYAKYLDPDDGNWSQALTTLITSIVNQTAPTGTFLEGEALGQGQEFGFGGLLNKTGETGQAPKAYLNVLLFDKDFNFIDGSFIRMTTAAAEDGSDVAHEKLEREVTVQQAGYAYIYFSNEDDGHEVYFDDFMVRHEQTPVQQLNSYYPFGGLHEGSWTRPETTGNKFLYNGASELNDHTQNYMTFFREYDPWLGRMTSVDPVASKYRSLTPYNYAFNDPVYWNDPSGADPIVFDGDGFTIDWDELGLWGAQWHSDGRGGGYSEPINSWNGAMMTGMEYNQYHNTGFGAVEYVWGAPVYGGVDARTQTPYYIRNLIPTGINPQTGWQEKPQRRTFSADYNHFEGGMMFANVEEGLEAMWNASFYKTKKDRRGGVYKENMAFITDEGLLVLPNENFKRDKSSVLALGAESIKMIDNHQHVKWNNQTLRINGLIHTHPSVMGDKQHNDKQAKGAKDWLWVDYMSHWIISHDGIFEGTAQNYPYSKWRHKNNSKGYKTFSSKLKTND